MGRKVRKKRELNNKILIICGGLSEKIYLQKFNAELAEVKIIAKLDNRAPKNIVQTAINMKSKENYKSIWCVFDKDTFTDFDEAIELAQRQGIKCAYSNQAYELWYILHYERKEGAMDRKKYAKYISEKIGRTYDKTDEKMYETMKNKMKIAINNAKVGHQLKIRNGGKPSTWESCTTMYQLVEELLRWNKN